MSTNYNEKVTFECIEMQKCNSQMLHSTVNATQMLHSLCNATQMLHSLCNATQIRYRKATFKD